MTKKKQDQDGGADIGNEPDYRNMFQPGGVDVKGALIRDLITSDKNNRTKTRIPGAFSYAVLLQIGKMRTFKTLAQASKSFHADFDESAISEDGASRVEYTTAVVGFKGDIDNDSDHAKMTEGNRK
jgi:hypothetical protein